MKERGVDLKTVTLGRVVFDSRVVGRSERRKQWKKRVIDEKRRNRKVSFVEEYEDRFSSLVVVVATCSHSSDDDQRAIGETSASRIPSSRGHSNSSWPFFDIAFVIRAGIEESNGSETISSSVIHVGLLRVPYEIPSRHQP